MGEVEEKKERKLKVSLKSFDLPRGTPWHGGGGRAHKRDAEDLRGVRNSA